MPKSAGPIVRVLAVMCLLVCAAGSAAAQDEGDLTARRRVFAGVGPGLRTVNGGGDGRVYRVASPWAGAVGCGGRLRSTPVNGPIAVAALPEGEVAVATLRDPHLVIVFDKNGRDVREFGDPEPLAERAELNRYLNIGQLATDAQGHLYYAFAYLPEPTVRQYDRLGYAGQDIQYTALEAMPAAQAARKEIVRQESKGKDPSFKRILTAVGVDRTNGEVWVALYNTLLHFDKEGNRRATYKIYTPQGARLEGNTILVEQDRLIVGSDPARARIPKSVERREWTCFPQFFHICGNSTSFSFLFQ